MRLRRRLATLALASLTFAALAGGALTGTRLGRAASAPSVRKVSIAAPEGFAGPAPDTRRSAGGFTGFGGRPALAGNVLRGGTVETNSGGNIVIATAESTLSLRTTSSERLFAITAASSPLRPGDAVQVYVRDGAVVAALRLPPGLGEGGNR
jgi:hypothetical protein